MKKLTKDIIISITVEAHEIDEEAIEEIAKAAVRNSLNFIDKEVIGYVARTGRVSIINNWDVSLKEEK